MFFYNDNKINTASSNNVYVFFVLLILLYGSFLYLKINCFEFLKNK